MSEQPMCVIILAYSLHPDFLIILGANRDELFDRPTKSLSFWPDRPYILAGRDLKDGGTWLGVTKSGKVAAITNYRDPLHKIEAASSRGRLVSDFLSANESPKSYLEEVRSSGSRYNAFSLLVGDRSDLYFYSNKTANIHHLTPGLYGLSNHALDTPWPKVRKGKEYFKILLHSDAVSVEGVFNALSDRSYPDDTELPDTGIGIDGERMLSPLFVSTKGYGTRSSAALLIERKGKVTFAERSFTQKLQEPYLKETRMFNFQIE